MADLQQYPAKICYTAAALLIVDKKVLFVKHKKLGFWLAPGGHVEPNELIHVAAERECFEETGVKVKAFDLVSNIDSFNQQSTETEFVPTPILTNLHWVCHENYQARTKDPVHFQPKAPWLKGCEQHLNFLYLVRPLAGIAFTKDEEETDDIGWFSLNEVEELETSDDIRFEVRRAFALLNALPSSCIIK